MKVLCDACNAEEASVFCCADEAALCGGCDRRVHRANKLASKHRRFSLHHPSSPALSPRCDVCQEKRAFLFCQEDRAILCRDCDAPIHSANDLTRKHNRFLLTGVKLSSSAEEYDSAAAISTSEENRESKTQEKGGEIKNSHIQEPDSSIGSSSISEYLTKVLPGWHVEDLLLDSASPALFYQPEDEMAPFLEADLDTGLMSAAREETPIWWVPKVPQVSPLDLVANQGFGIGKGGYSDEISRQRRSRDESFTVPEISYPSSNKRSRPLGYT